jgi:hypothetical protein
MQVKGLPLKVQSFFFDKTDTALQLGSGGCYGYNEKPRRLDTGARVDGGLNGPGSDRRTPRALA